MTDQLAWWRYQGLSEAFAEQNPDRVARAAARLGHTLRETGLAGEGLLDQPFSSTDVTGPAEGTDQPE